MSSRNRMTAWRPLLSNAEAVECERVVVGVAQETADRQVTDLDVGCALLHAHLASALNVTWRAKAERLVDEQTALLQRGYAPDSLYGGFVGTGWLSAHVDELWGHPDEDAYSDIDSALLAADRTRNNEYDLISGLVGVGVYFLQRLPSPRAVIGIRQIVALLKASAESGPAGATWHTAEKLLPEWQRAVAPAGYYNLGVAHGVPGVMAFLAQVQETGCVDVQDLLTETTRWVVSQRRATGGFPAWVAEGYDRPRARLAWCYGELGVAVALTLAARVLRDELLTATASAIAVDAARRQDLDAVRDAGLCHGTAGIAHLFNCLYQATGHITLGAAAKHWYQRTLAMRVDGLGIGGYRTWSVPRNGTPSDACWRTDSSFLTGATGTALALLAAFTSTPPTWDRLLLSTLDVPRLTKEVSSARPTHPPQAPP